MLCMTRLALVGSITEATLVNTKRKGHVSRSQVAAVLVVPMVRWWFLQLVLAAATAQMMNMMGGGDDETTKKVIVLTGATMRVGTAT